MKKTQIIILCVSLLLFATACRNNTQNQTTENTTISLYINETGQTEDIDLEEYICGVVAAEMDVNWPKEALAAQAILARTFTLEKIQAGGVKEHGTDASTDVEEFQAYNAEKINDNVRAAVQETKGKIVTYDGKPIKAWFFADGGGMTAASAEEGLSYNKTETPYIHSVEDPGADLAENENNHWEISFDLTKVQEALKEIGVNVPKEITQVAVAQKGESGRAVSLDFNDTKAGAVAFRLAIGSEEMKSTMIDEFAIRDGKLYIKGKGYGHGVGMSQWGARAMAEQGKTAEEIIGYFFADVEISEI